MMPNPLIKNVMIQTHQTDPLSWQQTTLFPPLTVRWSIASSAPQSGAPTPWKITLELEAPPDWTLATASSGSAVIEKVSGDPLILSFNYSGSFPPIGTGPWLETQWQTGAGPVFLRLDPQMNLATMVVKGPTDAPANQTPDHTLGNWLVGGAILGILVLLVLWKFLSRKPTSEDLARKWSQTMPSATGDWSLWEQWLARLSRDWERWNQKPHTNWPLEWTQIGELLPRARFGRPHNPESHEVMGKVKILGRLDNLAKLG